jgi:hypothetical protein
LNRRDFLLSLGAGGLAAGARAPRAGGVGVGRETGLVIGHLAPPEGAGGLVGSAAVRGAQLAAADVAPAAARVGRGLRLLEASVRGEAETMAAAARLVERGASVLLGGFDSETTGALAGFAAEQRVLFLNVGYGGDELRRSCDPFVFHVEASAGMRADALRIWTARGGSAGSGETAAGWSSRLESGGAGALNDRYRIRFGEPMSPVSWASWFAARVAWSAYAGTRGGESAALARYLGATTRRYDGGKAIPLSFRVWDHQLRQPLYIVRHTPEGELEVLASVPRTRDPDDVESALDQLGGGGRGGVSCEYEL